MDFRFAKLRKGIVVDTNGKAILPDMIFFCDWKQAKEYVLKHYSIILVSSKGREFINNQ